VASLCRVLGKGFLVVLAFAVVVMALACGHQTAFLHASSISFNGASADNVTVAVGQGAHVENAIKANAHTQGVQHLQGPANRQDNEVRDAPLFDTLRGAPWLATRRLAGLPTLTEHILRRALLFS
jgi:hypothetical protein